MLTPEQIAAIAAHALEEKKAKDVKILKTAEQTVLADYFVICNATSTTAVSAIADNIIKEAKEQLGMKPLRTQGMENNFWIILDYGHIVIHVFLTEYREFYRLEDLWADAPKKSYKYRKPAAKKKEDVTAE